MKKISLSEFKDYLRVNPINSVILSTENQEWDYIDKVIRIELSFENLIVTLNPNRLILKNKTGFIQLSKVKNICISEEWCALGQIFTVVCGDLSSNINDKEYVLVTQ